MTSLVLDVGATAVTAAVVSPDGHLEATARRDLTTDVVRPGWVEQPAEAVWQAVLDAARDALAGSDGDRVDRLGVTSTSSTAVLWDRETLGSPRAALTGPGPAAGTLAWLAEHEPRTWALVAAGRYAVGTLASYVVARTTRGTWHVTDVASAADTTLLDPATARWSPERCERSGVPLDALPEVVDSWGEVARTEPRTFLERSLPITGLVGERAALLLGCGCLAAGDAVRTDSRVLVNAGASSVPVEGLTSAPVWRSPAGVLTHALDGPVLLLDSMPVTVHLPPPGTPTAALGAAVAATLT